MDHPVGEEEAKTLAGAHWDASVFKESATEDGKIPVAKWGELVDKHQSGTEEAPTLARQTSRQRQLHLQRTESAAKKDYVNAVEYQPGTLGREISRNLVAGIRVAIVGIDHVDKAGKGFVIQITEANEDDFMDLLTAKMKEIGMDLSVLDEHEDSIQVVNNRGEEVMAEPESGDYPLEWKFEPPVTSIDVNGQVGVLVELANEDKQDWKVRMDNGVEATINRRNLAPVASGKEITENALVALVGLSDNPGKNGMIVVAQKYIEEDKSWRVTMHDGSVETFLSTNLVCAEEKSSFGEIIEVKLIKSLLADEVLKTVKLLNGTSVKDLRDEAKLVTDQKNVLLSFGDAILHNHDTLQSAGLKDGSTVCVTVAEKSDKLFEKIGEDLINSKREAVDPFAALQNCDVIGLLFTAAW